ESATHFLVSARTTEDNELALFMVPRDTPGLTVTGYPAMDGLRGADLALQGVAVARDARVGVDGTGLGAIEFGIDHGIAAMCAAAAGAMEMLTEITAQYLGTRKQFGTPLASFQALQHRMADMHVQKEIALSMAYVAAQALDENDPVERRRKLSAAKVLVAKAGRFIGQQAVQLHGGMGMTDELAVGDYFKTLTMCDVLLGDSDHHLKRYLEAEAVQA
ncbi:MAG TPA: acyl-CoA dehydrogenase, partial [Paraburkholderia sp.]|nr:acyl-CoA dehydrogenase [Paraburkholderia sp.]